jgi:uncharacterized protein (TIGR02145 family)
MQKMFYLLVVLFIMSTVSAQNKKLTLYYADSTKVVNITGLDSMVIFICGASKVSYGGKDYNTVLIGNQCWFKENLDIGTMIDGNVNQTNNNTIEKYCYGNAQSSCNTYGGLYQWNEAMQYFTTLGTQGICPLGWHIPTYAEFQTLRTTVNNDGNRLKAIGEGSGGGAGTNTSGFSALLAGCRYYQGSFLWLGGSAYIWSSTESSTNTYYLGLTSTSNAISLYDMQHVYGLSVRCIKD